MNSRQQRDDVRLIVEYVRWQRQRMNVRPTNPEFSVLFGTLLYTSRFARGEQLLASRFPHRRVRLSPADDHGTYDELLQQLIVDADFTGSYWPQLENPAVCQKLLSEIAWTLCAFSSGKRNALRLWNNATILHYKGESCATVSAQ